MILKYGIYAEKYDIGVSASLFGSRINVSRQDDIVNTHAVLFLPRLLPRLKKGT